MLSCQLVGAVEGEEELGIVGVALAIVGHAHEASSIEFETSVDLIVERFSVDTLPSHACTSRVSSLHDEARDYTVEYDSVVVS